MGRRRDGPGPDAIAPRDQIPREGNPPLGYIYLKGDRSEGFLFARAAQPYYGYINTINQIFDKNKSEEQTHLIWSFKGYPFVQRLLL